MGLTGFDGDRKRTMTARASGALRAIEKPSNEVNAKNFTTSFAAAMTAIANARASSKGAVYGDAALAAA